MKKTKNWKTSVDRLSNLLILFYQQLTEAGAHGSNGAFARALVDWALRPGFAIVTIPARPTVDEHALVRDLTDATVTADHAQVLCTLPLLPTFKDDSTSAILVYLEKKNTETAKTRDKERISIPWLPQANIPKCCESLILKMQLPRLHLKSFTGKWKREISISRLNRNYSNSFVDTRCIALYS